jgi:hypothetical protein
MQVTRPSTYQASLVSQTRPRNRPSTDVFAGFPRSPLHLHRPHEFPPMDEVCISIVQTVIPELCQSTILVEDILAGKSEVRSQAITPTVAVPQASNKQRLNEPSLLFRPISCSTIVHFLPNLNTPPFTIELDC